MSEDSRLHFMDTSRALFMTLGVPYHAALIYSPNVNWSVSSPDSSETLQFIAGFLHTFRMPAFFIVAGFFASLVLYRRERRLWLADRIIRLGVPFISAAILLNPVQMWISVLADPSIVEGQRAEAIWTLIATPGSQWVRHLWFLPALIAYSIILASIWPKIHRMPSERVSNFHADKLIFSLVSILISAIFGLWLVFWAALPKISDIELSILNGAFSFATFFEYVPYFSLGVLFCLRRSLWSSFLQSNLLIAATGLLTGVVYAATWTLQGDAISALSIWCSGVASICMSQLIFSILFRYANKQIFTVRVIVDASFTIYLFHQPIIGLIGLNLLHSNLPVEVEFGLIAALTLLLTFCMHMVVSRFFFLRVIFNGNTKRADRVDGPVRRTLGSTSS